LEELSSYQRIPLENLVKIVIGMCLNLDLHDRFVCLGTRVFETFDWSDFYYCAIDRSARSQSSYFFFWFRARQSAQKWLWWSSFILYFIFWTNFVEPR